MSSEGPKYKVKIVKISLGDPHVTLQFLLEENTSSSTLENLEIRVNDGTNESGFNIGRLQFVQGIDVNQYFQIRSIGTSYGYGPSTEMIPADATPSEVNHFSVGAEHPTMEVNIDFLADGSPTYEFYTDIAGITVHNHSHYQGCYFLVPVPFNDPEV